MMPYYDIHGLPTGDMAQLPELLGRAPTSYAEFTKRAASARGVHVH